jgi:hypothetical protein
MTYSLNGIAIECAIMYKNKVYTAVKLLQKHPYLNNTIVCIDNNVKHKRLS